jgi:hypothetical protein
MRRREHVSMKRSLAKLYTATTPNERRRSPGVDDRPSGVGGRRPGDGL